MKADWVVCIDDKNTKHLVKDKRYLVRWHGTRATVLNSVNSPFDVARGNIYNRERFKLVSTMNKETLPQITNYLLADEYSEIHTFKNVKELETYVEDFDEFEAENTQILFVYDNGQVTQRFLSDVVDFRPSIKPEFK